MNTRVYRQTARAHAAEQTGTRILAETLTLFAEGGVAAITLTDVATRAGVTVQTVIRRFGDRDGLIAAAAEWATREVQSQRGTAAPGDLEGSVDVLLEHYRDRGDLALRLLADEAHPVVGELTALGRRMHREWCARVFEPYLTPLRPAARRRRLAQLTAICDVQTWRLLRREEGLGPRQVRTALLEMLRPLTQEAS